MRLITLLSALEQRPLSVYIVEARTKVSDASIGATEWPPSIEDIEISGIAYDSREVGKGGLFVAVPGFHTDGRKFLAEAVQRGAVVAIGEPLQQEALSSLPLPYIEVNDIRIALANLACAFYGYPAQQLCTIGVTGTDGKTTTCNLISAIFEAAGLQTLLMTTANFRISGQEWENATRPRTLEALEVPEHLRRMPDADVTHAVIEATSHGLELQRVLGCNFDVGVVTNITHEHLDFHKTLDNYRRAKARLFEMLDPSRDKGIGMHPAFFFSSRRRHTRFDCDWSSDVCSSDLLRSHRGWRQRRGRRVLEQLRRHDLVEWCLRGRPHARSLRGRGHANGWFSCWQCSADGVGRAGGRGGGEPVVDERTGGGDPANPRHHPRIRG